MNMLDLVSCCTMSNRIFSRRIAQPDFIREASSSRSTNCRVGGRVSPRVTTRLKLTYLNFIPFLFLPKYHASEFCRQKRAPCEICARRSKACSRCESGPGIDRFRPHDGLCTLHRRAHSSTHPQALAVPQASAPTPRRRPPACPSITVNTGRMRRLVRDHATPDSPLLFIGVLYPLRTFLITVFV